MLCILKELEKCIGQRKICTKQFLWHPVEGCEKLNVYAKPPPHTQFPIRIPRIIDSSYTTHRIYEYWLRVRFYPRGDIWECVVHTHTPHTYAFVVCDEERVVFIYKYFVWTPCRYDCVCVFIVFDVCGSMLYIVYYIHTYVCVEWKWNSIYW